MSPTRWSWRYGIRLRPGPCPAQTPAAVRQRLQLHLRGTGRMARGQRHEPRPRRALSSPDPGQDRALAPDPEEPHPAGKLLSCPATWRRRSQRSSSTTTISATMRAWNNLTPADVYFGRGQRHLLERETHQTKHHHTKTLASPKDRRLRSTPDEANTPLNYALNCPKCSDDGQPLTMPSQVRTSSRRKKLRSQTCCGANGCDGRDAPAIASTVMTLAP